MDPPPPCPDDLNDLERRLSGWRPSAAGLDAGAMLFAAGRTSVRPSAMRFVWPAVTAVAAAVALALGVQLAAERSERLALVQQVHLLTRTQPVPAAVPSPVESPSADSLPPNSFLAFHRVLDRGLDAWPAASTPAAPAPANPNPPVIRVGRRDWSLDP
jgi:hypothetical protein